MRHLRRYLDLQQSETLIASPPAPELGLVVVIPCLREPAMIELLDHLHSCQMPASAIEVIVVINHASDASDAVRAANQSTFKRISAWKQVYDSDIFRVHPLRAFDLPPKIAGVGLARKIGMDEAMRRFAAIDRPDGVIASLDADCLVSNNYFNVLQEYFKVNYAIYAVTLAYAHRLNGISDARHRYAMVCYELFLRYVEYGWGYAGLPFAFTAIGSCFAVRANACARHHGMNRRRAGEDFYFLHKLARERPLGYIESACVYPSPRMSPRTPFGTGQAIAAWVHGDSSRWPVCEPERFAELRLMNDALESLFDSDTDGWLERLPVSLADFLREAGITNAARNMRANAATAASFRKRFYVWFDGLKAWRYIHRPSRQIPIEEAAAALLAMGDITPEKADAESLLMQYRLISKASGSTVQP